MNDNWSYNLAACPYDTPIVVQSEDGETNATRIGAFLVIDGCGEPIHNVRAWKARV